VAVALRTLTVELSAASCTLLRRPGELDHELKSPLDAEKHKIKEGVCSVAEGDNGLPAQRHSRP
jgi:hypothetical protein